jgi:hypothetical protein
MPDSRARLGRATATMPAKADQLGWADPRDRGLGMKALLIRCDISGMIASRKHHPEAAKCSSQSRGDAVAFMVHHLRTDDFDTWKPMFDADPVGRKQAAKGHTMLRSVENPNEVFTRVEFDSVEDAKAFRERLIASGALDRTTVLTPPTVVELVENITY